MVLNKRIPRRIKANILQYTALFLLIAAGMYFIASLAGSSNSIITGVKKYQRDNHLEDGEFSVMSPLSDEDTAALEKKGISLERMFSLDAAAEDGSVLRVFVNRKNINIQSADKGRVEAEKGEVMLEKRYAESHNKGVGDTITIAGENFRICGIGTAPDYDYLLKTISDAGTDSYSFSIAFVSEEDYAMLEGSKEGIRSEDYAYSYLLNGKMSDSELKKSGIPGLLSFLTAASNPRIGSSAEKVMIYRVTAIIGGIILLMLFSYIIALFVMHNIDKESKIIGVYYSMGVPKSDLIKHYIVEPVLISFLGGVVGTLIGFSPIGVRALIDQTVSLYSVPEFGSSVQWYIAAYGLFVPALVAAAVNYHSLSKKLSKQPLELLRNEPENSRIKKLKLRSSGFMSTFRIRNLFKEIRYVVILCIGIIMGMMMIMLPLDTYTCINAVKKQNDKDIKYTYTYTLKQPLKEGMVPVSDQVYSKTLKKTYLGYTLDITIMGIRNDNQFFDFDVETDGNTIVIAQGTATKYGYKTGDSITLLDELEDREYTFTIKDIVPYSVGLTAFMDIDSMRKLFGQSDNFYNTVMTTEKLDAGPEYIYGVTSKEDILEFTDQVLESMMSTITMCMTVGITIYLAVMFLMMKMMIDRSSRQISLFKILGYSEREIRKLYLDGNAVAVLISALIAAPVAKFIIDLLWPMMVYNQPAGYASSLDPKHYLLLWGITFLCYIISRTLLVFKLNRLSPNEILKDRE